MVWWTEIGLNPFISACVRMSNINARFQFHSANADVGAGSINAHIYCTAAVCPLSFGVLCALTTLRRGE